MPGRGIVISGLTKSRTIGVTKEKKRSSSSRCFLWLSAVVTMMGGMYIYVHPHEFERRGAAEVEVVGGCKSVRGEGTFRRSGGDPKWIRYSPGEATS